MKTDNGRRISFRLNYNNTEHREIIKVLDMLEETINSNRAVSSFVIDAVKYYINALNTGELTYENYHVKKELVTQEKLEKILDEREKTIRLEIYDQVVQSLITKIVENNGGVRREQIVSNVDKGNNNAANVDDILDDVMKWS